MQSLAAAIANEFAEPAYRADLGTIVGARSDDELAAWIGELCRERLGSDVVGARFAGKSVGAVFGLVLADGAAVVLKLFPPTFVESELRAIERCIAELVAAGFPMPGPLGPLFQAGAVWAAFSELVDGRVLDAHEPAVRCTLAEMLAELARMALDPRDLPLVATRRTTLWAAPHRLGLDYARPGGAWIDARASAAQRIARSVALPEICAVASAVSNCMIESRCAALSWLPCAWPTTASLTWVRSSEATVASGTTSRPSHHRAGELEVRGRQWAAEQRQLGRAGEAIRVVDRDELELGVCGHRQSDADQAAAEQHDVRSAARRRRRDIGLRRVRAVDRPEHRTEAEAIVHPTAVGRVEHRLQLIGRDGPADGRYVAADAAASRTSVRRTAR